MMVGEDGQAGERGGAVRAAADVRGCRGRGGQLYSYLLAGRRDGWGRAAGQRGAVMRFHLIDRIVEVRPGQGLRAVKNLTLGEEYLADHFPTFPVMPGVLMLQTLVEAGSWLLRLGEDFRHSVIVLREVKNIKYGT